MSDYVRVSLKTLSGGGAAEQFDEALAEVIEDILDPNTEARKARKVTLTLELRPSEDRNQVLYAVNVTKKLAGSRPIGSVMYVGHKEGEIMAMEQDIEQLNMPFNEPEKVLNFKEVNGD